jgi:hypothetical protein
MHNDPPHDALVDEVETLRTKIQELSGRIERLNLLLAPQPTNVERQ